MKFPTLPRLFSWLLATVLLCLVIGWMFPHQLPVSVYKLSLVTMAGVIGYWLDRSLYPYARPDSFFPRADAKPGEVACDIDLRESDCLEVALTPQGMDAFVFAVCMLRRAVIVGCAMLAMGLGA